MNHDAERDRPQRTASAIVSVLGTHLSVITYAEVLRRMEDPPSDRGRLFAFCNVHSLMTARRDLTVRRALADMDVAAPDGMPLVWVMRRRGLPHQPRVYGPDLMELALRHGVKREWQHFLLGATDPTLDRLEAAAERLAPGVKIVGRFSPPYRPLTRVEDDAIADRVRSSGANVLWVGLGMPKQELWMQRMGQRLPGINVMGVGAAFDLISGTVPQAPDWLQDRGLEWAYRLWREPRRLWRRYLYNNPAFVVLATAETVRLRHTRHE